FRETGGAELRTWVTSGFFQLVEDVGHGGQAHGVVDEVTGSEPAERGAVAEQTADVVAGCADDAPCHRVGLRVYRGGVQRIVASGDAEEARTLFEGFRPEAGHVVQLAPATERAV